MAARRRTVLAVVAVLGCLLLASGVLLLVSGVRSGDDGRSVGGILLAIAGLVCFRVLTWARRIRLMTRAGLAIRGDEDDDGSGGNDEHAAHP